MSWKFFFRIHTSADVTCRVTWPVQHPHNQVLFLFLKSYLQSEGLALKKIYILLLFWAYVCFAVEKWKKVDILISLIFLVVVPKGHNLPRRRPPVVLCFTPALHGHPLSPAKAPPFLSKPFNSIVKYSRYRFFLAVVRNWLRPLLHDCWVCSEDKTILRHICSAGAASKKKNNNTNKKAKVLQQRWTWPWAFTCRRLSRCAAAPWEAQTHCSF